MHFMIHEEVPCVEVRIMAVEADSAEEAIRKVKQKKVQVRRRVSEQHNLGDAKYFVFANQ